MYNLLEITLEKTGVLALLQFHRFHDQSEGAHRMSFEDTNHVKLKYGRSRHENVRQYNMLNSVF